MTETPEVERALDLAARRWPEEPRSRLLIRLIGMGGQSLAAELEPADQARRAALERTGWVFADLYDVNYLADLRTDWSE